MRGCTCLEVEHAGDALAFWKLSFLLPSDARASADTCCGRSLRPGLTPRVNPPTTCPKPVPPPSRTSPKKPPGPPPPPSDAPLPPGQARPPPLLTPRPGARRCAAPARRPSPAASEHQAQLGASRAARGTGGGWEGAGGGTGDGDGGRSGKEAVAEEAPAKSRRGEPGGCGRSGRGPAERGGRREEPLCEARRSGPPPPPPSAASSRRPGPRRTDKHEAALPLPHRNGGRSLRPPTFPPLPPPRARHLPLWGTGRGQVRGSAGRLPPSRPSSPAALRVSARSPSPPGQPRSLPRGSPTSQGGQHRPAAQSGAGGAA